MTLASKTVLGCAVLTLVALAASARAQHQGHEQHTTTPPASSPAAAGATPTGGAAGPRKITMEELHRSGGVPLGWKFALPGGDPAKGRQVFVDLECYKCHAVQGENFPAAGGDAKNVGPELTGMGAHHPAEYFAQSIVDPNAVILAGPGFTGPDGRSIMPDYRDSLTFAELVDLVAYIKSLGGGAEGHHHHEANAAQERTAGPYKVRLEYTEPGQPGHTHGTAPTKSSGHLMVFVSDITTGEPVPYLPVSAAIRSVETAPRTVRLRPMIGGSGFHYGADVTLPDDTVEIKLTLGAPALKTMGAAAGRFGKPVTLSFDWE